MLRQIIFSYRESYVLNEYSLNFVFDEINFDKGRLEPLFFKVIPETVFSYDFYSSRIHVFPFKIIAGETVFYITYEYCKNWISYDFFNELHLPGLLYGSFLRARVLNTSGYGGGELRFFSNEEKFLRFYESKLYDNYEEEEEEEGCCCYDYEGEELEED